MLFAITLFTTVTSATALIPRTLPPLDIAPGKIPSLAAAFPFAFPGENARIDFPATDCNNKTVPSQIRLAFAGTHGMSVSWNTNQQLWSPTVYYGTDKDDLSQCASSKLSFTYATSSTYNNHVTIKKLKPDTTYYYIVNCDAPNNILSFRTARKKGDGTPYSFAMVGDMG